MSIITDEMVAVARRAFSAAFVAAGDGQCALTAALAVVAPMIAKAEREACARVADGTTGDPEWPGEAWIAQRIAAAIRARSTEEGQ